MFCVVVKGEFLRLFKEKRVELLALAMDEDALSDALGAFLKQTIKHSFTTRMLAIVDDLSRSYLPASHYHKVPSAAGGKTYADVFPKRAGGDASSLI